jgi:hypothetical protein
MTEQELMREIKTDYVNVFRISDYHDNKFRRKVIKATRFPIFWDYEYLSRRKNKWLIFLEARSKKEIGDSSRITLVCTYQNKNGHHAVMVTYMDKKSHLIIYPPHFFSRYAERCGIDLSGIELIKRFFKHNASYVFDIHDISISDDAFRREIYGSTKEGIALGMLSTEGNIMFKTFITYDMTKGEQIAKFAENEKIRQELHEKN